jgi:hypothetical protein
MTASVRAIQIKLQVVLAALFLALLIALPGALADPIRSYLFMGHTRNGNTTRQGVVPIVERIDYNAFDMTLLGGDITYYSSKEDATLNYLDRLFTITSSNTLFATGGHDLQRPAVLQQFIGRPLYYQHETNGITFCVLNTQDDEGMISGAQLAFLQAVVADATNSTDLVILHHKVLWLIDNPDLEHHLRQVGATTAGITAANWYADVQPMLDNLQAQGTDVLCLSGERTNFTIEHTMPSGVRFMAAGLRHNVSDTINDMILLTHDVGAGELDARFVNVLDLPLKPNHPIAITEVHWNAPVDQGGIDGEFIEIMNTATQAVDVSGMFFESSLSFTFPENIILAAGEIILLVREPAFFSHLPVRVFDWGSTDLFKRYPLILRLPGSNEVVDYTWHLREAGWPAGSDGEGYSLILLDPMLDNGSAPHWRRSAELGGTPGAPNLPPFGYRSAEKRAGDLMLTVEGVAAGVVVQPEFTDTLDLPQWQALGGAVTSSTYSVEIMDMDPSPASRYYRLRRVFP